MALLNALPFDMQAEIASRLSGPDLANLANAVPDFQPFFQKTVAPVFSSELKRIGRIMGCLKIMRDLEPSIRDISNDTDHYVMTCVLDRDVKQYELFEDKTEYCMWRTLYAALDLKPSLSQLIDIFVREWNIPFIPPNIELESAVEVEDMDAEELMEYVLARYALFVDV